MKKIKVGITMGDPSGIGPYITSLAVTRLRGRVDFTVIGDRWVFEKFKIQNSKFKNYTFIDLGNVRHQDFKFGKVKAEYGRASVEYLDKALELLRDREIDCLVTCPISKEALHLAGRDITGHTEYLARRAGIKDYVMMLLNRSLKMSLVTRHIPLADVPGSVSRVNLENTILITQRALRELFGIKEPRLVVCGLNPHASDNGAIGGEENRRMRPVIKRLQGRVKYLYGPVSADVAIYRAKEKKYDCVIAIYHDQALIPLKLLDRAGGVNLTLGLPYIRTSPLHGTAFDIAAQRRADPSSLIEAIKLAIKCALNLKKA